MVIEEAIRRGKIVNRPMFNGVERVVKVMDEIKVVVEGDIVITVIYESES